ncbi:hypothetical protein [Limnoraphis robusta]|uniref:Uncharacterized protein n=1 Tax=Limnoraphis robusta CCNP1315 TaxID=3110306 RepID=A0ABU5TYC1_9CYAN|nr:hypothetical protein [Limnoraphis robusta]MEA5519946.1 hypothetical protein [Limnoraphis robusta CCNP1315]MEA5544948.1 hypothetical protein [Limnoraphis robusta CCNP1324]
MSTSPLGLNDYLRPPETLGRQGILKVRSPLIQTSQLMLPQTVENSENLFTFTESLSGSETPQKPISRINRFVGDDSELESTSEANINPNISDSTKESQTHPSPEENLPNNPLSELHPRLGKQLIQTQSLILTTTSDKLLSPQTPEYSESQLIKNKSDNLPVVQPKWSGDISQPISNSSLTQSIDSTPENQQAFPIQPSLNSENLTNLNLIQSHSPLIQQSDLIVSPKTSEPSPERTSFQNDETLEPWSSQFNLSAESVPATDNVQESWSNLTELIDYENFNPSSNSQLTSESSKLITREQKESIPDSPASVSSSPTKAEKVMGEREESVLIDEEQLEMLAIKVYNLLRQKLEIERESHHFKTDGSLPWLDTISQINPAKASAFSSNSSPVGQLQTQTGSTVSLVNYKLQTLTRKVYQLLQFKIETERERLGFYYRGNIPW